MTPHEMIAKLVSFDTTTRNSNMALIDYVRGYLAAHGIDSNLVPNEDGSKANLYASVGPVEPGGIVLSGHTDVVPVDGQDWLSDPFTVVERQGKLYGRGTSDMKSFYAIALALVPEMLSAGLRKPIHFALTYDEETGCLGAPSLIDEIAANVPAPRAVFVGEPTSMQVVTAHKGAAGVRTQVIGHEAHSSQVHRGVSAVMVAARLVTWLEDRMHANAARADADSPFEPSYTSMTCGTIRGGTAANIIARQCEFKWDVRSLPNEDARDVVDEFRNYCEREVLPPMRAIATECDIITELTSYVPGLAREPNGDAEQLARMLTGDNAVHAVAYAAEAGQFQQAGFSTVICGPGSIDQAHQPNEFIELEQVEASIAFSRRLIEHLSK